MTQKVKFNPIITRIKLNPEQAVLACAGYSGRRALRTASASRAGVCSYTPAKRIGNACTTSNLAAIT